MPTSVHDATATRVWFDDDSLWLELSDGRRLAVPLAFYPRLLHASPKQRSKYELSGGGRGVHWEDLDEDLSVEGLLAGIPDQTRPSAQRSSVSHPIGKPTPLVDIEGLGRAYATRLRQAGIATVEALLKEAGSKAGRVSIAKSSGIDEGKILEWVNRADLMRIKGVGSEYSDLLEAGGVDTVKELAQRNGANLYAKLVEVNQAKKLVRRVPTQGEVEDWVKQAGKLPPAVAY